MKSISDQTDADQMPKEDMFLTWSPVPVKHIKLREPIPYVRVCMVNDMSLARYDIGAVSTDLVIKHIDIKLKNYWYPLPYRTAVRVWYGYDELTGTLVTVQLERQAGGPKL